MPRLFLKLSIGGSPLSPLRNSDLQRRVIEASPASGGTRSYAYHPNNTFSTGFTGNEDAVVVR